MRLPEVADLPELPGLPDVLTNLNGAKIATASAWRARRVEIAEILAHYEYGHMPPGKQPVVVERSSESPALGGAAKAVNATLRVGSTQQIAVHFAMYVPTAGSGPFPVLVKTDPIDGAETAQIALAMVKRGYAIAGYQRHDLDQDNADRSDGMHPLYPDYDWATLAVWAWGAIRVVDYLLTRHDIDHRRIVLTGHSRGGKTALLASALDERIALAAPHNSGAGGAGCYRIEGEGSETLALITDPKRFAYWFHPRLRTFVGHEKRLPFDQHFLKALVAPRPLLCLEALGDHWANPLGTQRSTEAAQPVFDLLGAGNKSALWWRDGGHECPLQDWHALADYADHVLLGKPATRDWRSVPFARNGGV
jgi:hypothetical protein